MRASQLEKTITALELELQVLIKAISALKAQRAAAPVSTPTLVGKAS